MLMLNSMVAGIVAEYNPFHNGHAYLIQEARKAGATHIVAVMSGNFVQRGEPACMPKVVRANAAIAAGADLVLELPLPYAMATAERFAFGAISLLVSLGCVNMLAFGSECGNLKLLEEAAKAVSSPYCHTYTRHLLESGIPYAQARQEAVSLLYGPKIAEVLSDPNNILGVEYLRQLSQLPENSIRPFTIERQGPSHDSPDQQEGLSSASRLRELLAQEDFEQWESLVPEASMRIYQSAIQSGLAPFSLSRLENAVLAVLRRMEKTEFASLPDVSEEGLSNRLYDAVRQATSLEELYTLTKTKRYPLSRIRRLVWSAFLGVPSQLMQLSPPYIRVLSFNKKGAEILSLASQSAQLPLSHSLARLEALEECKPFTTLEARATDLYSLGLPSVPPCGTDYTQKISLR